MIMKISLKCLLFYFIIIVLTGCSMKERTDLLLLNAGKIYSVDDQNHTFEAIAVKDGKIQAIGSSEELSARYSSENVIDASGQFLYPGFIDAHCHFIGYANNLKYIDLAGSISYEEVLNRLEKSEPLASGEWLVGRGWDQNLWSDKKFPDKTELDLLYPSRPVMLIRIDGHAVLANQEALNRAGIFKSHRFRSGEVEMVDGRLSGILTENAADLMRSTVPEPDLRETIQLLERAQQLCFAAGLTSVSDAGMDYHDVLLIDSLQKQGILKMHIYAMLNPTSSNFEGFIRKGVFCTDHLMVRSVKLYADGSLGSRTALLKKPYTDDPSKTGILVNTADSMRAVVQFALLHGYQVNTHAIGDSAVRMVLDIYGSALKSQNDLRWRIEHAQVVDPKDTILFARYSIIPSIQATHATSDMTWAEDRLGQERLNGAYAYQTLLRQNGWLANGTDFPIENISPILTFYAAVSRKDLAGKPVNGFRMKDALSREEALRSISIWAARANFCEPQMGSLEVGKEANIVILDRDIMTIPISDVPKTNVLNTYRKGQKVYPK